MLVIATVGVSINDGPKVVGVMPAIGCFVGVLVTRIGSIVGCFVGVEVTGISVVGVSLGEREGDIVVGFIVGLLEEGSRVGLVDGCNVDGVSVGANDIGFLEGDCVGALVKGACVGLGVTTFVGLAVGLAVIPSSSLA